MRRERDSRYTLRNRFDYWFDNRMTKGSLSFIRILIAASVLFAVLIASIIIIFKFHIPEDEALDTAEVYWDSIATLLNAWMPYYGDGVTTGHRILMAVVAIAGVLFTSVLIGIVTSAIEEKIDNLKRGNSAVIEKDHIVVLGFYPGEYTLLQQLILAAAGKPACVVVAEDMDREEMEQNIDENLDVPKNFRIVCRTVDITDPASIEKCAVDTCRTVIVSPTDDMRTAKAVLAVSSLLGESEASKISVNAIISKDDYRLPASIAESNNISSLQTHNIMAKMIAHTCTQTGLSATFHELFRFEGTEFYLTDIDGIEGLTFEELIARLDEAVPVGVFRDGKTVLNPSSNYVLKASDKVLIFAEECDTAKVVDAKELKDIDAGEFGLDEKTESVIIGHNPSLPIILNELPENVDKVYLVCDEISAYELEKYKAVASGRNLELTHFAEDPHSEEVLVKFAKMADHIVVLNDHDKEIEEEDMEVMFLLLNLRDIRKRYDLNFNITVEMQRENNQKLVGRGDHTDFLVTSSMSSLILAQLAENPDLLDGFREILSNEGNELFLKNVGAMELEGTYTVRDLRRIMYRHGFILLGLLDPDKNSSYDLSLDEAVTLTGEDDLIVLGEV